MEPSDGPGGHRCGTVERKCGSGGGDRPCIQFKQRRKNNIQITDNQTVIWILFLSFYNQPININHKLNRNRTKSVSRHHFHKCSFLLDDAGVSACTYLCLTLYLYVFCVPLCGILWLPAISPNVNHRKMHLTKEFKN